MAISHVPLYKMLQFCCRQQIPTMSVVVCYIIWPRRLIMVLTASIYQAGRSPSGISTLAVAPHLRPCLLLLPSLLPAHDPSNSRPVGHRNCASGHTKVTFSVYVDNYRSPIDCSHILPQVPRNDIGTCALYHTSTCQPPENQESRFELCAKSE